MKKDSRDVTGIDLQWFAEEPPTITPPASGDGGEPQPEGTPVSESWKADKSLSKFKTIESLATSYKSLEGELGGSVRRPKPDAPAEEWSKFYSKLGRPEKPDEYQVQTEGVPETLLLEAKTRLHEKGLTAEQMRAVSEVISRYFIASKALSESDATQKKLAMERAKAEAVTKLKEEFGSEYDRKVQMADKAFETLIPTSLAQKFRAAGLFDDPDTKRWFYGLAAELGPDRIVHGNVSMTDGKTKEAQYAYMLNRNKN